MKHLVFLSITLLLAGCLKDSVTTTPQYPANSTKNGIPWQGSCRGYFNEPLLGKGFFNLEITHEGYPGAPSEHLGFTKLPYQTGTFPVFRYDYSNPTIPQVSADFYTFYGDIGGSSYLLDSTATNNRVQILSIDKNSNIVELKFSATFVNDLSVPGTIPDTLKIENGTARVKIFN
jgi:hypothetical protein